MTITDHAGARVPTRPGRAKLDSGWEYAKATP
jgi:hypothetical protein